MKKTIKLVGVLFIISLFCFNAAEAFNSKTVSADQLKVITVVK